VRANFCSWKILRLLVRATELKGGPKTKKALGANRGKKKLFKNKVLVKMVGTKLKGARQPQLKKEKAGMKGCPKPSKRLGALAKIQKGGVSRSSTGVPGIKPPRGVKAGGGIKPGGGMGAQPIKSSPVRQAAVAGYQVLPGTQTQPNSSVGIQLPK
jgi:hypothetical protein